MSDNNQDRINSFINELKQQLRQRAVLDRFPDLASRLHVDGAALAEAWQGFVNDDASASIVRQTGVVLAAFIALTEYGLADDVARAILIDALGKWVRENAEAYTEARLGIRRDAPDRAFADARSNFKARGEERFGDQFAYQVEQIDDDVAHFSITRCLFNDLLRKAGYPQVIPVFCALDIIWAADATHPRYNLAFERPSTLAEGADRCRFNFSRR